MEILEDKNEILTSENERLSEENVRLKGKLEEMKLFFNSAFKTAPRLVHRD